MIRLDDYTYLTVSNAPNVSNWRVWWLCNDGRYRPYESGYWGDACRWGTRS